MHIIYPKCIADTGARTHARTPARTHDPDFNVLCFKYKPETKNIKIWPEGALSQLQDCFEHTEWSMFDHLDLQEHTETVLFYIKNCTDTVTVEKRVRIHPNQKPWMTSEVRTLLRSRDSSFISSDEML